MVHPTWLLLSKLSAMEVLLFGLGQGRVCKQDSVIGRLGSGLELETGFNVLFKFL